MKIGILSMQKIHNYGSLLQALSLKMQLEARGHDVYFVDIIPGKQLHYEEAPKKSGSLISRFDRYLFKRIENYLLSKKMAKIHINDYETYLQTPKMLPEGEMFDLVVIGSDEVFNATTPSRWGFTTQLFGDVKNAKRVVTYAASCGHTTYEDAKKHEIVDELNEAMQRLEHISVRDSNTLEFVRSITGQSAELNVDPVFISNYDALIPALPKRKPYMLIYAYGNRISNEKEIRAIKEYAKKHGLDIISVGMQQRWCKNNLSASAFELLSYVKGAECIVTDTFHGTVFSIKYNKRFVTLIRESNRNKLGGLLNQFELRSRSVDEIEKFEEILDTDIDYYRVNAVIAREQNKSYEYLDMITRSED